MSGKSEISSRSENLKNCRGNFRIQKCRNFINLRQRIDFDSFQVVITWKQISSFFLWGVGVGSIGQRPVGLMSWPFVRCVCVR